MRSTLLPLALLSACHPCHPCHPWEDLEIDASMATDPSADEARIQAGIDTFVAWTLREETCVESVHVAPELGDGSVGQYWSRSRRIVQGDGASSAVTVHELCHALDHEEGWVSESATGLLETYTMGMVDNPHYPTETGRIHEAFARICDDGPETVAMLEALAAACGLDTSIDAAAFVRDVAFPQTGTLDWPGRDSPFSFTSTTVSLQDSALEAEQRGALAVWGAAGLFVHDLVLVDPETEEAFVHPSILLADPVSGTILDRLALDPHGLLEDSNGNPSYLSATLLGSSTDPFLLGLEGDSAGKVWRVRSDPLSLEPASWPDPWGTFLQNGYERDGILLVQTTYRGPVLRIDLETMEAKQVAEGQDDLFYSDQAEALFVDDHGAVAAYGSGDGITLVGIDWNGSWTWMKDLPLPAFRISSLVRLGDGSIVVTPVVSTGIVEGDVARTLPVTLWYHPDQETWSAPAEDCSAIAGNNWLAWGDAPLRVSATREEDGVWGLQASRLELP